MVKINGKEPACKCWRHERRGFDPWVGKILWRRKWQVTKVFLPGESYGQRSPTGYGPWDHKESDTTERLTHTHTKSLVGFPGGAVVKKPPTSAEDLDLIPGSGRAPGGGNGNLLQCSCL